MTHMFELDRRSMLGSIAAIIGAASLPAEALAAPKKKGKRLLAAPQFALLGAVADTMFPKSDSAGALDAKVPARLDSLLANWAAPQSRSLIIGGLDRIEAAARAQKGKGFAALSPADRLAVLRPHDAAALKVVPPPADAPPSNIFMQQTWVADQGYFKLKELIYTLYYYSPEASASELLYEHVPGTWQPSITLSPESRPFLGIGPF